MTSRTITNDLCLLVIYHSMFKMKTYIPTLHGVEKSSSSEPYGTRKPTSEKGSDMCNSRYFRPAVK